MQVADFGCGSGEMSITLARLVAPQGQVTAIDVLPSALESVRVKAQHANIENITPLRANLELLRSSGLADNSQDFVFVANILWQASDKGAVLAEAARILKPGAIMVALEWEPGVTALGPPEASRISQDELKGMITSAGLTFQNIFPGGNFHYGLIAQK